MKSRQTTPAMGAVGPTRRTSSRMSSLFVPPEQLEAYLQAREVLRRVKYSAGCSETNRWSTASNQVRH